ncbi:glycine--tRNA ligase subunit beta [Syntrophomonas erecta]
MSKDFLLEIGAEEIPSAYLPAAIGEIKQLTIKKLGEGRLDYQQVNVYATPRRLTLHIKELAEYQRDATIENRGPKKNIAFDSQGNPTKAGLGFARGQGVAFEDLQIREAGGIEYLFAVKVEKGNPVQEVLPAMMEELIKSISFPKSMRWGFFHQRFARPIRWLLALYGEEIMPLNMENISSSNQTYGHRFLAPGPFAIHSVPEYFTCLKQSYVILDQDKRKQIISEQIKETAQQAGGKAMENSKLLEEITYLVEYPTAFFGSFSSSYLEVPPEVLTTSMIEHQRYFPVFDANGSLLPGFIGVRNGIDKHLDIVRAGNERVLKARLEDALFFWKEDTKKPLESMVSGLAAVMFHERLGSMMEKIERMQRIAVYIADETGLGDKKFVERVAWLCKADLVSSMVHEFPELQGIMGRYYAQKSGEDEEVNQAIFEHYLPRFSGDILPATGTGIVLSLADKIYNLVGCFSIGIRPTGSQDPYALRRQALGIVHVILDQGIKLDLEKLIERTYGEFVPINPDYELNDTVKDVIDFIMQRLRGVLLERGFSYDVIDAVQYAGLKRIDDFFQRVQVIQQFKNNPLFEDFMVVYNRSNNLSKKWSSQDVNEQVLEDDSEKELFACLAPLQTRVMQNVNSQDYLAALTAIAEIRPYLDSFFEAVMVMVEDEDLKAARLGMLKKVVGFCHTIANFGKVVQ